MSPTDPVNRRESLRLLPWIALLGLVLFGLAVLILPDYESPEELLAGVQERRSAPPYDESRALEDLSDAAQRAEVAGDDELLGQILVARADVLLEMGARAEARSVLEDALDQPGTSDSNLELRIAQLMWEQGEAEQAEERIDRLLEGSPDNDQAWAARARILERQANAELASAHEALAQGPFDPSSTRIQELVQELGEREVRDPTRKAALAELRSLLGRRRERDYERGTALAKRASQLRTEARRAHAQSLSIRPGAEPAAALIESIHRARRPDLASELGQVSRTVGELRSDWRVALAMLEPLETLGDTQRVQSLATGWKWDEWPASGEFCEALCLTLYKAGFWGLLTTPANEARERLGENGLALSFFLRGMASYARQSPAAATDLSRFLSSEHPGLKEYEADAWMVLASQYREQQKPVKELEALREAVRLEPELADAQTWLRLALVTKGTPNTSFSEVEHYWTRAMELSPETAPAMVDAWFEYSELALPPNRRRFDLLYQDTRSAGYALPAIEVGPGTRYRFAVRLLAEGEAELALRTAEGLLGEYPDLIPALDLAFEASQKLGRRDRAASIVLQRLTLLGRDETVLEQMSEAGARAFEPEEVIRAMRADPEATGRLVVARSLLDRGQPEQALVALGVDEPSRRRMRDVEWRVEAARALIAVGRLEAAERVLVGASRDPLFGREADLLEIELAVAEEDEDKLRRVAARLVAERDPDREMILQLAEALVERGLVEPALEMGRWLDGRPEMRGGDLLLMLARAEMFRGDFAAADELLTRAEAFDAGGEVERMRILLAVEERRWTELPRWVAALRDTGTPISDALDANLSLLEEQLSTGTTLLRDSHDRYANLAEWQLLEAVSRALVGAEPSLGDYFGGERYVGELRTLLRGAGERVVDPRELLALLLVLDDAAWAPWSLERIERLQPERRGGLWRLYLTTRVLRARGLQERADELEVELRESYPHFGPGWDLAERRLAKEHHDDPFALPAVRLRSERLQATAPDGWPRPELDAQLDRAILMAEEGDAHAARVLVEDAFVEAAEITRGRQVLARLKAETGDWTGALEAWLRVLPQEEGLVGPAFLEEALDVLRRGARDEEAPLRPVTQSRALEELARRFPLDPRVALVQARYEAARTPANAALGIGAALGVLESFRDRTAQTPLSRLVPGSAQEWADWLRHRSPDTAEELLVYEIAHDPGQIELWVALAETLELTSREEEALGLYLDVAEMTGSAPANMAAARILSRSPARGRLVEEHVLAAERAAGGDLGVEALYLRIRARLGRRDAGLDIALDKLSDLWEERDEHRAIIDPFELGRTWIQALLQRREAGDLERLDRLSRELAEYVRTGLETEWLLAYQGLAGAVEERQGAREPRRKPGRKPKRKRAQAGPVDGG